MKSIQEIEKSLKNHGIALAKCSEEEAYNACLYVYFRNPKNRFVIKHKKKFALFISLSTHYNN